MNNTTLFEPWIQKEYSYELEKKQYTDIAFCLEVSFAESLNTLISLNSINTHELVALGHRSALDQHTPLLFAITKHLTHFAGTKINNQKFPSLSEGDFAQHVCAFFGEERERISLMIEEVEKRRKNALELCGVHKKIDTH
jgi:hypothetical protein